MSDRIPGAAAPPAATTRPDTSSGALDAVFHTHDSEVLG
jgi:hypothetical protein